ncbi:MAG: hypothetical protein RL518_655 [Pseudomonadota bacterium]|jgi:hypothetical protein
MVARFWFTRIALVVLLRSHLAWATPHDFEAWMATAALVPLDESKTYQLFVEVQPRLGDDWQRLATAIFRTALVYDPIPSLSVFTGYGWLPTFYNANYYRTYRDEQRLWQQILYKHDLWNISLQHRLRQEQRWIEDTDGVSNRTRYMLRGSLPLTDAHDFGITVFDEFMVTLNTVEGGPWRGYDRNRLFVGTFWRVGNAHYEIGYLGEHAKRFGDDERWVSALAGGVLFTF